MYFQSSLPIKVSVILADISAIKVNRQVEKDRKEREEYEERKRSLEEDDLNEYDRMRLEGYVLEYEGKMRRQEAAKKEIFDIIEKGKEKCTIQS